MVSHDMPGFGLTQRSVHNVLHAVMSCSLDCMPVLDMAIFCDSVADTLRCALVHTSFM